MIWQAYGYYLFAAAALIGTFAAAILLVRVLAARRWAAQVAGMVGVVPPFINVLGVLFGLRPGRALSMACLFARHSRESSLPVIAI